jgi:hypothetical protein
MDYEQEMRVAISFLEDSESLLPADDELASRREDFTVITALGILSCARSLSVIANVLSNQ